MDKVYMGSGKKQVKGTEYGRSTIQRLVKT
jgi:hypothetical protein